MLLTNYMDNYYFYSLRNVRRMRMFIDVLCNTPQLNISKLKNHFM